jgi:hypothetical protein
LLLFCRKAKEGFLFIFYCFIGGLVSQVYGKNKVRQKIAIKWYNIQWLDKKDGKITGCRSNI